jgi:predicted NBD/HSP70 family sugar kinase
MLTGNGDSVVGVGLEINVDYLSVCVLDLLDRVRYLRVVRIDNREGSVDAAVAAAAELTRAAVDQALADGLVPVGVCVGVPGTVEVDTGRLRYAPNLGWENLPLADMLAAQLQRAELPVRVGNEANLGALGELWGGQGQSWGDYFHVSGEIGVGGGLVVGGQLMLGVDGFAGEFGHVQIDRDGPACPCGSQGCLERFVGQEALLAAAGVDAEPATSIGAPDGGGVALLVARAQAGDPKTLAALDEAGRILGGACATVVHLFNPETVVLGGIFAALAPWILCPVEEEMHRQLSHGLRRVQVAVSTLGPDAAVRGAASEAMRPILADPASAPRYPRDVPGGLARRRADHIA